MLESKVKSYIVMVVYYHCLFPDYEKNVFIWNSTQIIYKLFSVRKWAGISTAHFRTSHFRTTRPEMGSALHCPFPDFPFPDFRPELGAKKHCPNRFCRPDLGSAEHCPIPDENPLLNPAGSSGNGKSTSAVEYAEGEQ